MRPWTQLAGAGFLPLGLGAGAQTTPATLSDVDDGLWFEACRRLAGTDAFPGFFATAARSALERQHGTATCAVLARAAAAWDGKTPFDTGIEPIAQDLLVMLYTGETGAKCTCDAAPFYPWALAWQTLGFTAAPSLCGGEFAAWTRA